ncbi:PfkB family carbohydrate kinase, partial [Actinomyces sp. MRS3W]|uniref:PfkB family carbohydrate kinase n=1 Tax=Actinomyces sp. MRS3W TaxID=2800796 RepID=UPI0028FD0C10
MRSEASRRTGQASGTDGGQVGETASAAEPGGSPCGLFVGLTVVDVIHLVDAPPGSDEKIRARDQVVAAGGPATNAAVAFAALGGRALLAAPVGTGPLAQLVRADLDACGVELLDCAAPMDDGTASGLSVSSCTVSAATGERSVVSTNASGHADPALLRALAAAIAARQRPAPDVVLVDGHYPDLGRAALDLARAVGALAMMDAGSWKDDAADLPGRCDVVAPSARFYPPGRTGPLREPDDVAAWLVRAGAGAVVLTRG